MKKQSFTFFANTTFTPSIKDIFLLFQIEFYSSEINLSPIKAVLEHFELDENDEIVAFIVKFI